MTPDELGRVRAIVGELVNAEQPREVLAKAAELAGHQLASKELAAIAAYATGLRLPRPRDETMAAVAEILASGRRWHPADAAEARRRAIARVARRIAEQELPIQPDPAVLRRRECSIQRRLVRALRKTLDIGDTSITDARAIDTP